MKAKNYIRYSEAFKRQVVSEIERGKFTGACDASRSYGIKGARTVSHWLRLYGDEKVIPQQIKVMNREEIDETKELKNRVRELEKALADAHMKGLLSESYFEIACKRMGTDPDAFKKKHATNLFEPPRRKEGK